jgi:hypothetical protein
MGARFFNNAGPSEPAQHYCIDPLKRIRVDEIERLIDAQRYFVLHAPRQTGKTTCLITLMRHLNAAGRFRCAYANIEDAQAARGDYTKGIPIVAERIAAGAQWMSGDPYPTADPEIGDGRNLAGLSGQRAPHPVVAGRSAAAGALHRRDRRAGG